MKKIIYSLLFSIGYKVFQLTGRTPHFAYISMRQLFCITNGAINDRFSRRIGIQKGKYQIPAPNGVLGNLTEDNLDDISQNLSRDGAHIFDSVLSDEKINHLVQLASSVECNFKPAMNGKTKGLYDPKHPETVAYTIPEEVLLSDPIVQELLSDPTLIRVAQEYLGAKPIQDMVTMWWSTSLLKSANSKAAQLFHFDMDRIKFLKFFFYLTDVNEKNGPHVYVKTSHKNLPQNLRKDRRLSDEEVEAFYSKSDILEICGKKGTIIAADTRGIHKGKPLLEGDRLIFQIEFTNSLFGQDYGRFHLDKNTHAKLLDTENQFNGILSRLTFK